MVQGVEDSSGTTAREFSIENEVSGGIQERDGREVQGSPATRTQRTPNRKQLLISSDSPHKLPQFSLKKKLLFGIFSNDFF